MIRRVIINIIVELSRVADLLKQRNAGAPHPKLIFADIQSKVEEFDASFELIYNNSPQFTSIYGYLYSIHHAIWKHPIVRGQVSKQLLNISFKIKMEDDQEKYLEDARKVVKEQAYYMKAALDKA